MTAEMIVHNAKIATRNLEWANALFTSFVRISSCRNTERPFSFMAAFCIGTGDGKRFLASLAAVNLALCANG